MHQSCLAILRFYLCGGILKTSNLCDFLIKKWTLCLYVALVFPDGQSWLRHLILEGWYLVGLCSIEKTRQTILWLTCLPFHWQLWCVFCTAVNHLVCFLNVFTIDPLSPPFGSSPFGVHHLLSELPTSYAGSSILHYVDISHMVVISLFFVCVGLAFSF